MSTPKFHHYVPRFYLARFSGDGGFLNVFDKTNGRVFRARPKAVGGETHFYDEPELEQHGAPRFLMETQFAALEGEAQRITECWLRQLAERGKVEIPTTNKEIMSLFLALQLLRTAESRRILSQFMGNNLEGAIPSPPPAESEIQSAHVALLWDDRLVRGLQDRLANCIWLFGFNGSPQGFYSSDHPALLKNFESSGWLLGPRLYDPGMYLVYPLTPAWVLYCKDREKWKKLERFENCQSPVEFSVDMVNHENSGQVGCCSRFVFSSTSDFSFAREYCRQSPGVTDPGRNRFGGPPPLMS